MLAECGRHSMKVFRPQALLVYVNHILCTINALTHSNRVPVVKFVRGRWRGNVDADVKVVAAMTGSRRALPFELRLIEREFDTMKSLAHPNIVQGSNQQS